MNGKKKISLERFQSYPRQVVNLVNRRGMEVVVYDSSGPVARITPVAEAPLCAEDFEEAFQMIEPPTKQAKTVKPMMPAPAGKASMRQLTLDVEEMPQMPKMPAGWRIPLDDHHYDARDHDHDHDDDHHEEPNRLPLKQKLARLSGSIVGVWKIAKEPFLAK